MEFESDWRWQRQVCVPMAANGGGERGKKNVVANPEGGRAYQGGVSAKALPPGRHRGGKGRVAAHQGRQRVNQDLFRSSKSAWGRKLTRTGGRTKKVGGGVVRICERERVRERKGERARSSERASEREIDR